MGIQKLKYSWLRNFHFQPFLASVCPQTKVLYIAELMLVVESQKFCLENTPDIGECALRLFFPPFQSLPERS